MSLFGTIKNFFSRSEADPNKIETVSENRHPNTLDGPDISDIGIVLRDPDTLLVEDNIKNAIPTKRGLLPNELKLLDQANHFKNKANQFQAYWKYQYGFNDVQGALSKLEKGGFIKVSTFEETLHKTVTIPQLKKILKDHGEKLSGKKADLIQRVLNLQDIEDIEKQFDNRPYKLTSKGESELAENGYIKSPFFTVWELNHWVHEQPQVDWKEIVEQKLLEEGSNYKLYLWFLDKKDYLKSFRCLLREISNKVEGFPAFNPSYYGLPDRDKEKLLNDIQLLSDSLHEVYLPKLMFFQDLFSLDESKFRELVKRELEFDRSSSQKFSIETLMAIIFEEELQKIALIEGQKENFTK